MPELPDVEGQRRYLARYGSGHRIESVRVLDSESLRNTSPQGLGRAIKGGRLADPRRHGKWLIAPVDGAELLMHFGMTGLLSYAAGGGEPHDHPHDRLVLRLDQGELRYRAMRKLGGVWLVPAGGSREEATGPLGPDALDVGADELAEMLSGRRGGIKSALMDQELIAGLGNLLSDEILWQVRIHPRADAGGLEPDEVAELAEVIREVLRASNRRHRVPPEEGWLTRARDDEDSSCPRCGAALESGTVNGRTSYWCPREQRP